MAYVFNSINNAYKFKRPGQQDNDATFSKNVGTIETPQGGGAQRPASEFTQANSLMGATQAILDANKGNQQGVVNTFGASYNKSKDSALNSAQTEGNKFL